MREVFQGYRESSERGAQNLMHARTFSLDGEKRRDRSSFALMQCGPPAASQKQDCAYSSSLSLKRSTRMILISRELISLASNENAYSSTKWKTSKLFIMPRNQGEAQLIRPFFSLYRRTKTGTTRSISPPTKRKGFCEIETSDSPLFHCGGGKIISG